MVVANFTKVEVQVVVFTKMVKEDQEDFVFVYILKKTVKGRIEEY